MRCSSLATPTADDLSAAYRQIVETAHLYGVKVIGGAFDAVIDFDAATRDASDPKRFGPRVDSPDLLHPANPGYEMMADAVNLAIFSKRR